MSLSGSVIATTYTYIGPTYTAVGSPYTTAMSVTGTFDTVTPLPANMPETDIGPDGLGLLTTWSFFDGVNTLTQANSSPYPFSFKVGTDAEGNITSFNIELVSPQPPHTVGELINSIEIAIPAVFGTVVFDAGFCASVFANVCNSWGTGTQSARSVGSGAFTPNFTALPPTIAKSFTPGSVLLGQATALSFALTNPNAATLTGVGFTDNFPAGMVIAAPNGLSNTCGGTAIALQGTGTVSLTGASIAGNSSCTLTVNVTPTGTGALANTTDPITSNESLPGNTASATLQVTRRHVIGTPIPAVERWALGLLGLLLAMVGALVLARQRPGQSTR